MKNNSLRNFSAFSGPISNIEPNIGEVNIPKVYKWIVDPKKYKNATDNYRLVLAEDSKKAAELKKCFDYTTFSVICDERKVGGIKQYNGLIALDIDHIGYSLECFFEAIKRDKNIQVDFMYRTLSGDGLRLVLSSDATVDDHEEYYNLLSVYLMQEYKIEVDQAARDLTRASFLCYDPKAYINPSLLMGGNNAKSIE